MKQKKLTLIFSSQGGSKSIELDQGPIYLGSASQCQINFGNNNPPIKAVIQFFQDPDKGETKVLFSSLDPQLKLHYKNQAFDQILLYPSEIQDVSIDQIRIDNQELVGVPAEKSSEENHASLPSYKLPESFIAYSQKSELPKSPVGKPVEKVLAESNPQEFEELLDDQNVKTEYETTEGELLFSTIFNEEKFVPTFEIPFLSNKYHYSDYIDPDDETVVRLPETEILKEVKGKSVQIVHLNNGIVLNEQFFSMDLKRISLSRKASNNKSFQVHDLEDISSEFIYIQNNKVFIDEINGFSFQKYHPESGLNNVNEKSFELEYENERVVFTKGTSQILVRITDTPPELESGNLFDLDDLLVKCVVGLWLIVSVPMVFVMFTDINMEKDKPAKEIVVIYKRKKPVEKEILVKVEEKASEAPQKSEVDKKPEVTITQKTEQKNIKKIVKNKKIITKNMEIVKRKKTKKVTAKLEPRKVKKIKSYSFDTSSMMKTVSSKPTSTAKDVDNMNSSFNEVIGKNKFKMQKGIKSLDAKRNKMDKYGKGDIKGLKTTFGVRGISSKTNTSTSYQKQSTKILGAVDPELIRKLLREYIPHFRHCYQKELLKNPDLNGIFDLDFQITPKGEGAGLKVVNSKTKFTQNGLNCLKTVIKRIRFPRPRGGGTVDVVQPLNFYSQTL